MERPCPESCPRRFCTHSLVVEVVVGSSRLLLPVLRRVQLVYTGPIVGWVSSKGNVKVLQKERQKRELVQGNTVKNEETNVMSFLHSNGVLGAVWFAPKFATVIFCYQIGSTEFCQEGCQVPKPNKQKLAWQAWTHLGSKPNTHVQI